MADVEPPFTPDPSSPVALTGLRSGTTQCQFGAVAADVSYVTVRLGNGTVLTLRPVTVFGARVVAFALPAGAEIVSATAYLAHGEISTAIPFNDPILVGDGVRGPVGSVRGGQRRRDQREQLRAGYCGAGNERHALDRGHSGGGQRSAAAQVTRLVVTRPDGSTTQVRPVQVGGQKFFAFASAGHKKVRWAAYDSSGGLVASSTLIPDVAAVG
jgi:hypothetical protein